MTHSLTYRLATLEDLTSIVQMLQDDPLGATREALPESLPDSYYQAFQQIAADPNQELTVAEMNGETVATFQLTFIPCLTHQGGRRAQVEAVRVHSAHRGKGIGTQVFAYIQKRAVVKGCHLVQLTTDKHRPQAIRFYESLGYVATHEGMKLKLK